MSLTPGFYALIGPNAAGKTHYLRSLAGPGAAFVPASADARFAGRTVDDHLRAARIVKSRADIDLPAGFAGTRLKDLSVGQRRLLTIAVALAAHEPLLLLDEPFDGIDVTIRQQVRERLISYLEADSQRTVIMASHRAEDFVGLADSVILVSEHSISEPEPLDELRARFPMITGPKDVVDTLAQSHRVLSRSSLGPMARATLAEPLTAAQQANGAFEVSYPTDSELIDILAAVPARAGKA